MKILVSTTPGAGHVNPVAPLASAFVDRGHHVTWVTAASSCKAVSELGFETRAAGLDAAERRARLFALHPELLTLPPRERRPIMFAGGFGEVAAPAMIDGLEAAIRDVEPDLIVHEVAELAAVPLAASHGIPLVTVAFSGVLPSPVLEVLRSVAEPLWQKCGQDVPEDLGMGTHPYLHPFPPAFGQRPSWPEVHDVRPTSNDRSGGQPSPTWLSELGRDRPLVYVTFGTEVSQAVPWPMIVAGIAAADVDAVITTGHDVDTSALAEQLRGSAATRIRIEQYVPQSFVIPRASIVVSHGGAGTVLAAATAGVAQIVIPIAADQFENADAVTSAGVGVELDLRALSGDLLAGHIADIATRHALHAAADGIAEQIAAMASITEIAATLAP